MAERFRVACVQNCATDDMAASVAESVELTREAHAAGAELICLPEYFSSLREVDSLVISIPFPEPEHPVLAQLQDLARELGVWLLLGSLAVRQDDDKVVNRSYLLDSRGQVKARYDKIHLFDVDLDGGESYRESATIRPGAAAVVADTPWGKLGLSICYDIRFPHLYQALARAGADFLTSPAAFTKTTGQAHWHVLQRARAIETGCFVFAPSQYGDHGGGPPTFGHSLIVDPWGSVLADAGDGPGYVVAEVDPAKVAEARRKIPALRNAQEVGTPVRQGAELETAQS